MIFIYWISGEYHSSFILKTQFYERIFDELPVTPDISFDTQPRNDSEEWLVVVKHAEGPVILKAQGIQSPCFTFQ